MKNIETAPAEPITIPTKPETAPITTPVPQINPNDPWDVPQPSVIPAPKAKK